jgi:hypothetical protein
MMVGTDSSKSNDLFKVTEMVNEVFACKCGSVVRKEFLGNNAMISTVVFVVIFCLDGGMGCKGCLKLNMYVGRGMVNENTTPVIHMLHI